jgi:hypothetical protein
MKYLFLLNRGAEEDLPAFGTPEAAAMFRAWKAANDAMAGRSADRLRSP